MGHASTRITDDIYTDMFQDELNEAADQIEQGLEAAIERRQKTGESAAFSDQRPWFRNVAPQMLETAPLACG